MARGVGELAGRLGNFIGSTGRSVQRGLGFTDSGLDPEDELHGVNPRRAYWSAALADLSNVAAGGQYQNLAGKTAQAQQLYQEKRRQAAVAQEQKNEALRIAELNAQKQRQAAVPDVIEEAQYLFPDDVTSQREWIKKRREKSSGVNINLGQDYQEQVLGQIPDAYEAAVKADQNLRRYNAMLDLIPQLGKTGTGAEVMTNVRGFLHQAGMERYGQFLDTLGEVVGVDLFSGEQGAREMFRALSSQDIVGRARELYPVSNSDMQILRQMSATLSGQSDPRALQALIEEQIQQNEGPIEYYNWTRSFIPEGMSKPPPIGGQQMDLHGLGSDQQQLREELEEMRKRHGF